MIVQTQETTDSYAVVANATIDSHERGRREVRFDVRNLHPSNQILLEIQESDDNSTWSTYLSETDKPIVPGGSEPYVAAVRSPWKRYYRARVKSSTPGSAGVAEVKIYRLDYIQTGTIQGNDVGGPEAEHAEAIIDAATMNHFASRRDTITLMGSGSQTLDLTQATLVPILSVDSATVIDAADVSYSLDTSEIFILDSHFLVTDDDYEHHWYRGDGRQENVTIVAYFGSSETPAPIIRAAESIAANQVVAASSRTGFFQMEKIGDYTYQISQRVETERQVTGDPEVDRILSDYRNPLADMQFGAV